LAQQVAVIGAGMAGAACARTLTDAGWSVRVFDKGRSVGGRMAQRRVAAGTFDHGAQYLSAREPTFASVVSRWRKLGLAADWPEASSAGGDPVLVGVPAMNAPVKDLLTGIEVTAGLRVARIESVGGGWVVRGEDETDHGPFDALVLAVPAPQAVDLLATVAQGRAAELVPQLGAVRMAPCWSAMATFEDILPLRAATLRGKDDIVWAARNGSKPGRDGRECWTVHAGPAWSAANLERRPEEVAPDLLRAFAMLAGIDPPVPVHLEAHRWRFALVERPLGRPCLHDPALRLGLCGDWCLGPRVEAAYLSGRAMAAALANPGGPL
jgi:hypothetical protein